MKMISLLMKKTSACPLQTRHREGVSIGVQNLKTPIDEGMKVDEEALQEGAALAAELMPIFHFKADDVAWD
jgi:hypothetical protein